MQVLRDSEEIPSLEGNFLVAINHKVYERLLVHPLTRDFPKPKTEFLAVRDVAVTSEYQGRGHFKKLITALEASKQNILVDDIISLRVKTHLINRGYTFVTYFKDSLELNSCYLIQSK